MKIFLAFAVFFLSSFSFSQQIKYEGLWSGSMVLMGQSHELLLKVNKNKKKYEVHLLHPQDSTTMGLSADVVEIEKEKFEFAISAIGAKYKGVLNAEDVVIEGEFEQMGMKAPLSFHRERQEKKVVVRPQEPQPPFAYHTKEYTFKHISESLSFGGTLVLPEDTTEQFPILVFSSGSGAQDRNEEMLGHKPFLVIADYLAQNGIGSFRFDDRGTGESEGVFQGTSLEQFATDLESAYGFVKAKFPDHPVGLIGHSEGGMHALMTAKKHDDVAFIISLAGPGTTGRQILEEQQYLMIIYDGKSEEMARWNQSTFSGMLDIIDEYSQTEATKLLTDFLSEQWDKAPEGGTEGTTKLQFVMGLSTFLNNEFGRQFSKWDVKEYLPYIEVPVLSLIGSKDFQVPAESNSQGIKDNLSVASQKKSQVEILEGLNHLFQKCDVCNLTEYGELDETINPIVLEKLVKFVQSVTL